MLYVDHRVLVHKRKKKKRFPSESKKVIKKSPYQSSIPLLFIRSTERRQNRSGIYDWYGLFLITFSIQRETSSSSSSFVPRPCDVDLYLMRRRMFEAIMNDWQSAFQHIIKSWDRHDSTFSNKNDVLIVGLIQARGVGVPASIRTMTKSSESFRCQRHMGDFVWY